MSKPTRYTGKIEGSLLGSPHWEHPEGEWVKWEDYARLKAEVERLNNNCDYLDRKLDEELEKSAMLCGQVESLRKELADAQENYHIVNELVAKMLKESKQS